MKRAQIAPLTTSTLDIEELERRLELAAQVADCGCCADHGNTCGCHSLIIKEASTC